MRIDLWLYGENVFTFLYSECFSAGFKYVSINNRLAIAFEIQHFCNLTLFNFTKTTEEPKKSRLKFCYYYEIENSQFSINAVSALEIGCIDELLPFWDRLQKEGKEMGTIDELYGQQFHSVVMCACLCVCLFEKKL